MGRLWLRLVGPSLATPAARRAALALLAGWLAILVSGAAVTQILLTHEKEELEELSRTRSLATVDGLKQTVMRTIESMESVHALLQNRHDLLAQGNAQGAATIADHLVALTQRESIGILQVATTDRAGIVNWSTVPDWQPLDLSDRVHIRVHFDRPPELFFSAPLVGRVSGRWSVQVTYPLQDAAGHFAGVSVVSLDPVLLSARLGEIAIAEGTVAALLRLPDGALLARSHDPERHLGRAPSANHPAADAARERERGVLHTRSVVDGRQVVMAFRRVYGDHLVLAYAEDWESAGHIIEVLSLWGWLSFALLMLVLAVAGFVLLRALGFRVARRDLAQAQAQRAATLAAWTQLETLLQASPVLIYAGEDPRSRAEPESAFKPGFLSPNLRQVLGCDPESFVDPERMKARMEPAGWEERVAFLGKALAEGRAAIEYRWNHPASGWRWLREEARLVNPAPAPEFGVVGYLLDVTEERQARARAAASARLNMLGELAANMAHELNQPLAVISLAAENAAAALEFGGAKGIQHAMGTLELIASQGTRCKSIIQHLRAFSQPDERQAESEVNLQGVIAGAMLLVSGALRDAEITLEVDLPADLPPVRANVVGAEQVLVNLLLNARDVLAELPPGQPRRITIRGGVEAGRLRLIVSDTGGGIPAGLLDRLFEPFVTTKPSDKGTGLGLAICQSTMRGFGGDITARNGRAGAEFMLDFGLGQATPGSDGEGAKAVA